MHSLRRPLTALFATLMLVALFAVPAYSADREFPASAATTTKPATVGVLACKSNAFYSGRQLSFRTKISRQVLDVPQQMAVKVEVWRRLNEYKRFKKIKLAGEKGWNTPSDINVGIYQHDVVVAPSAIETWAEYRAKATFRWSSAETGATVARKTVWTKSCKQRVRPPKLKIIGVTSVPVAGSSDMIHTVTVKNAGRSEIVDVPMILSVDGRIASTGSIDSIGPGASSDLQLQGNACNQMAEVAFHLYKRVSPVRPAVVGPESIQPSRCN